MIKFTDILKESSNYKKGDVVIVKNAKSYDSLMKTDKVEGTVLFVEKDYIAVKVGKGQLNVNPKDVMKK